MDLEESCDHIILHCSFASQVWNSLGFQTADATVKLLWTVARPATVPKRQFLAFLLLVSWLLWKQRNDLVFQHQQPNLPRFWIQCRDEARLWSLRFKPEEQFVTDAWCAMFTSM
ncbi:hypothetical protein SETIT_4G097600v2 [Setaria italica]|uniref:Reverse transcriptase zinc-binding domain-containing protein n=1 Tax=Setaria italica TaxID=4555 RepID=A0A368QUG9_SETIT|nr:hypothetical protein SETIT_4G097600v2 [Setaria italica]